MSSGAIIFISNLWGGKTSDRNITMHSGFLDNVSPGHEIMADRGFLTSKDSFLYVIFVIFCKSKASYG